MGVKNKTKKSGMARMAWKCTDKSNDDWIFDMAWKLNAFESI